MNILNGKISFAVLDDEDTHELPNKTLDKELVDAIRGLTNTLNISPNTQGARRRQRRSHMQELTKLDARADKVSTMIKDGRISLPQAGQGCVWAMHDTSSNISVADHTTQFPGATLNAPPS